MPYPPQGDGGVKATVDSTETAVNTINPNVNNKFSGIKGPDWNGTRDTLEHIGEVQNHTSHIFPEATNETITFTAGGTNNVLSAWTEIVDNNAVTLTSKFAANTGHLASFQIEGASVKDKTYLFEIAYGEDKTTITRYRFIAGDAVKLPAIQQIRVRAAKLPSGESIYYRMACETADATCILSIRYYLHN